MLQTKECKRCKQNLTLDKFYNNGPGRRGVKSRCKLCIRLDNGSTPKCKQDPVLLAQGLKSCSLCLKAQPFSEYHKHSRGLFGLRPNCKSCRQKEDAIRYQQKRLIRLYSMQDGSSDYPKKIDLTTL